MPCPIYVRANLPEEDKGPDDPSFGRNGSEADMLWCGWSAGAEVVKTSVRLGVKEQVCQHQENNTIKVVSGLIKVSANDKAGDMLYQRERIINGKVNLSVKLISVGEICFVALSGEPVVEYGLKIEEFLKKLGFANVFVLGFSDGDAGYIPTKEMFSQGGYEVKESALLPACEKEILEGVTKLAEKLADKI